MPKLFQQDDCAPDSLEYFNYQLQEKTGMSISEFKATGTRADPDDMTIRHLNDIYYLDYCADDPYYELGTLD